MPSKSLISAFALLAITGSARADVGLPDLPALPGASAAPAAYGTQSAYGTQAAGPLTARTQSGPLSAYGSGAAYSAAPQADLSKMQDKVKELLDQAKSVQDGEDRLNTMIDRLLSSTGVHFSGQAVMDSDNLLRLTPVSDAQRVWPTVGYFDFHITARPKPELQADVIYRMEKVFGGFWGSLDISGVRWFNIKGQTAIGYELGMFHYKHSPLTFWVPEDPMPFEPEVLDRKRREGRETVMDEDHSFPLQGAKLDATLLLFGGTDLDLEGIAIRTAISGNKNSGLAFAVTFPYDQYIVGGTASLHPDASEAVALGGSYFELMEVPETNQGVALLPQQRGNVIAGDVALQLAGKAVVLKAEGALSNYTPAYGTAQVVSWTTGGAGNLFLDITGQQSSLKLHALYVDEQFINYAAQTREQDTAREPGEDFITGNNLYNPREGAYTLPTVNNLYFQGFNSVIFATNQGPKGGLMLNKFGVQPAGIYLTHGVLNRSLPLGFATPNRSGFGGEFKGNYMDGLLQPTVLGGMYQEPFTAYDVPVNTGPRKYTRGGGGVKADLSKALGLPLTLQAGVVIEDTRSDSFVAFTSTRLAYDADWQAFKDVHLMLGFQHTDFNGSDFFDTGSGSTWGFYDRLMDEYLGGIDWRLSKSTVLYMTYAFQDMINARNGAQNYQNQEYQTKLSMRF